jgi:glutamate racemase
MQTQSSLKPIERKQGQIFFAYQADNVSIPFTERRPSEILPLSIQIDVATVQRFKGQFLLKLALFMPQ